MPLFELLVPEVREALLRRHARRLFRRGQAAGCLMKAAAEKGADTPVTTHALAGRLYVSKSRFGLLSVPNAFVRGAFDALQELGAELPLHGPKKQLNAHITIFHPYEIDRIGGEEKLVERGHAFNFNLGPLKTVEPAGWPEMSRVWFFEVRSPAIEALRRSYGLESLPKGRPLHITVAVRRRKVLQNNEISKGV